jgi:hypothetical protein
MSLRTHRDRVWDVRRWRGGPGRVLLVQGCSHVHAAGVPVVRGEWPAVTADLPSDPAAARRAAADLVAAMARAGVDVGEWLSLVLAEAAADLGSTEALVAARPGSWESSALLQLVRGRVGWDDDDLPAYRRT